MKIDKFYCTHYTKLPNRKDILLKDFALNDIDVIWVECEPDVQSKSSNITIEQYSSIHKHIAALKDFVKDDKAEYAMVFEDDVLIDSDFKNYISRLEVALTGIYFDFISVGNCSVFDNNSAYSVINPNPNQLVYIGNWKTTACAHCMLFSKQFANECISKFQYQEPFDIFLDQHVLKNGNYIVGRTYPYIKQRTIDGDWSSAIPTQFNGFGTWYGGSK